LRQLGKLLNASADVLVGGLKTDDRHHTQPDGTLINFHPISCDNSTVFQSLNTLGHCGLRQPYPPPQLLKSNTAILLKRLQDCYVLVIQAFFFSHRLVSHFTFVSSVNL
jgi:hypothetical protein